MYFVTSTLHQNNTSSPQPQCPPPPDPTPKKSMRKSLLFRSSLILVVLTEADAAFMSRELLSNRFHVRCATQYVSMLSTADFKTGLTIEFDNQVRISLVHKVGHIFEQRT